MASSTTRLGLRQVTLDDVSNFLTDASDNFDDIDAAVGAQVYAASALPSSGYSGKLVWDTTNTRLRVQQSTSSGSAWRDVSVPVWTSLAAVTGTHTGELAFQTSDNTLNRWTGAAWTNLQTTVAASGITGQGASYTRLATQACANNTDVFVDFDTAENTTTYITKTTSTGSVFTINVAGWYTITAQAHWDETVTAVGRRDVHIVNGANSNIRYATQTGPASQNGLTGTATGTPNCAVSVNLTAGTTVKIMVNQNQGSSLNLKAETYGICTRVTFLYGGA